MRTVTPRLGRGQRPESSRGPHKASSLGAAQVGAQGLSARAGRLAWAGFSASALSVLRVLNCIPGPYLLGASSITRHG